MDTLSKIRKFISQVKVFILQQLWMNHHFENCFSFWMVWFYYFPTTSTNSVFSAWFRIPKLGHVSEVRAYYPTCDSERNIVVSTRRTVRLTVTIAYKSHNEVVVYQCTINSVNAPATSCHLSNRYLALAMDCGTHMRTRLPIPKCTQRSYSFLICSISNHLYRFQSNKHKW